MAENNLAQSSLILERYIENTPSFPNWKERAELQERAYKTKGEKDKRRLKLWDYFFRINREAITKPYTEKILQLQHCLRELRIIQQELRVKRQKIEHKVRQWAKFFPQRNRRIGLTLVGSGILILAFSSALLLIPQDFPVALFVIGFLLIAGSLIVGGATLLLTAHELTENEIQKEVEKKVSTERLRLTKRVIKTLQTVALTPVKNLADRQNQIDVEEIDRLVYREHLLAWLILVGGIIFGLVTVIAGASFIWSLLVICTLWFATREKTSSQYIEKETEKRLALTIGNFQIENQDHQGVKIEFSLNYYIQLVDRHIKLLDREIKALLDQIPDIPADSQVKEWFDEMIKNSKNAAIRESGMEGMDDEEQVPKDRQFCICIPAKYQRNIPDGFCENENNVKHLNASRSAKVGEASFEFSGVYYMEFILIGSDMLTIYSVFFDFIMQRSFSPKLRAFHFLDIVSIQIEQNYRNFDYPDGTNLGVDDIPQLILSLTSGEQIQINYPNDSYIKRKYKDEFDTDVIIDEWAFNMEQPVKNANRHIRRQMLDFKKRLVQEIE